MLDCAYDQIQYESHPYRQSHPEHLYTLAKVYGLTPTHYENAKILELGCASAGNIIPIAYNYPDCHIVGLDLSEKQIEAGQCLVNALHLKNIELFTLSILDVDQTLGKFDYIICHGIYSWVPEPVRNKILNICRDHLHPQGIAYISYNTYPGWNMVQSMRDMMLFHTQSFNTSQEKATQSRALLQFLVDGLEEEKTAYSDFLHKELELLKKQPDSYLLHDHLEEVNSPIYLHAFIEQANKNNLDYLSEAKLYTMFSDNLPEKAAKALKQVTDIVRNNQYMDFIRNKRFRSTLLCLNTVKINRELSAEQIENFYIKYIGGYATTEITQEAILTDGVPLTFSGMSIILTVKNPISKIAMQLLQAQQQVPIFYDDFIQQLKNKLETYHIKQDNAQLQTHCKQDLNLMRLVLGGIIELSSGPALYITSVSPTPQVTNLVKEQAKLKHTVTNQRHEVIKLNDFERILIQELDGHTTQETVINNLCKKVEQGDFNLTNDLENKLKNKKDIRIKISELCTQTYQIFAHNALLVK